jgi:hypothetical protein
MLHKVFYVPMRNDHLLSDDVIHQVFANLEKMIEIHVNLNEQMKAMKASGTLIGDVGDMLLQVGRGRVQSQPNEGLGGAQK